jgi:hypothetical protein
LLSSLIFFTGAHRAYSSTLTQFLVFFAFWTGRAVKHIQDCLLETLVDKAPQSGKASILEAFLLWMANSVASAGAALTLQPRGLFLTGCFADAFQHACVHLKYVLRGAAMMHCIKHIIPKRQSAWCIKWFAALPLHTCLVVHALSGCPLNKTHSYLGHGWYTRSVSPLSL